MKISRYLFMLATGTAAFAVGFGWVSIAKYLLDEAPSADADMCFYEPSAQPVALDTTSFTVSDVETVKAIEEKKRGFDPEGYYAISGKDPKGFERFAYFAIVNKDWENSSFEIVSKAPEGWVVTVDSNYVRSNDLVMKSISIGEGKLFFETETMDGVSYKFAGDFIERGNFTDMEKSYDEDGYYVEPEVLEGVLTKIQNGKEISTEKLRYHWINEIKCSH